MTAVVERQSHLPRDPSPLPGGTGSHARARLKLWSKEQAKLKAGIGTAEVAVQSINYLPRTLLDESRQEKEHALDQDDVDIIEAENLYSLRPGDFVDIPLPGKKSVSSVAVFIRSVGIQYQFFTEDGGWSVTDRPRPRGFPVHEFVSSDMLAPLLPHLPDKVLYSQKDVLSVALRATPNGDFPAEAAAPILQEISRMQDEILTFRREYISMPRKIHEKYAEEDHFRIINFDEVLGSFFGRSRAELPRAAGVALIRELRRDPNLCQFTRLGISESSIMIPPKKNVRRFEKVKTWAREYQEAAALAALGKDVQASLQLNPLSMFIDKVRRVILRSRKIRSPTTIGALGPSGLSQRQDAVGRMGVGETYSESDISILDFIWDTHIRQPVPLNNEYAQSIASLILRAIGAYPGLQLGRKTGLLLLREAGYLSPWASRADHNIIFASPYHPGPKEKAKVWNDTEALDLQLRKHMESNKALPYPDTMKHLRKDWGQLPVFCIDLPESKVLDDGFSLEAAADSPDSYWIHAHIAHPSAFIDKDHELSKRAALFAGTIWTAEKPFPLFPGAFSRAMSLGRDRPVLTYSTLLTLSGEVKDVKVTPGTVRNVVRLTPSAVDRLFGAELPEYSTFALGDCEPRLDMTPSNEEIELAVRHKDTLEQVATLIQARYYKRREAAPYAATYEPRVPAGSSRIKGYHEDLGAPIGTISHWNNDPPFAVLSAIKNRSKPVHEYDPADFLNQIMVLAGESGARWLAERDIPSVYRFSRIHPEFPLSKLNSLSSDEDRLDPRTGLSIIAAPHVFLQVAQYVTCTSPLRRYLDLLGQWQVDTYLRAAANAPESMDAIEYPFPKDFLERYLKEYAVINGLTDTSLRDVVSHWQYQAFFRAFHFKEAELPDVWDVFITNSDTPQSPDDSGLYGRIMPWNLACRVLKSGQGYENSAKRTQYLPVKIELVDVSQPAIHVRPVGLASDECTRNRSIHIKSSPKAPTEGV